jgi:hypothetical protein
MNPAREVSVRDQVEWLRAMSADEIRGEFQSVFGEPPPHSPAEPSQAYWDFVLPSGSADSRWPFSRWRSR